MRKLSFKPTIGRACDASWAAMEGSARARHCAACDRQVHNFAAMTVREIEALVQRSDGRVCARITQRADGSLVTLDGGPQASMVAKVAASAALMMGAAGAAAQSAADSPAELPVTQAVAGDAVLVGKVGPAVVVTARAGGFFAADARPDANGFFRLTVRPGVYDVELQQGQAKTRMVAVTLKTGEQRMPDLPMNTTVAIESEPLIVMGDMATITTRYSFWYVVRHPVRYTRYLRSRHRS